MTASASAKWPYVWKMVRCVCGQSLGKVRGEYEKICHKCGAKNVGDTALPRHHKQK